MYLTLFRGVYFFLFGINLIVAVFIIPGVKFYFSINIEAQSLQEVENKNRIAIINFFVLIPTVKWIVLLSIEKHFSQECMRDILDDSLKILIQQSDQFCQPEARVKCSHSDTSRRQHKISQNYS